MTERLTLAHDRAPGDVVCMTALVRDLQTTYPGRYKISVATPYRDLWLNNPHVVPRDDEGGGKHVRLTYGHSIGRAATNRIHFLTAWHWDFKRQTGVEVPLTLPKPDLHLTEEERENRIVAGRYWLILSGGKSDFTTKIYSYARHQQVVDGLVGMGIPVVQAGAKERGHHHPRMEGALDLVGKTTLREFLRLIAQADGVICTITAAMHIAAAFDKPCVVTGGGREEAHWEAYLNGGQWVGCPVPVKVPHVYLHTMGQLACCEKRGCWRSKVTRDEEDSKKSYCHRPVVSESGQRIPECLDRITAANILEGVFSYYAAGLIPE